MPKFSCFVITLSIAFIILNFIGMVSSQVVDPKCINAVKTSQPPIIDGRLDDQCWQEAPQAKDFVDKFFDRIVDDQTIAYLLYDDENIYIAFQCYDSQPDKILARETKRDGAFWSDDHVAFSIDPFHSHRYEDRSIFIVNAIGTQFSVMAGGRASKTEWKGDWKSAVSRTKDGWSVEMLIPFNIINYQSTDETLTIGINFERMQPRTDIRSFWSNIGSPEQLERDGHLVGIKFPRKKRNLSVMTYAFGGIESKKEKTLRAGLDAKYSIAPEMTAVASISPDFSNVEQDVESIDFSYRERFYPDRRPFFQEGESILSSGTWDFYSRRISQFDFGLKTYGKIGRISIGALDCIDFSNMSDTGNSLLNRNDLIVATSINLCESSGTSLKFVRMDDERVWNHVFMFTPYFKRSNLSVVGNCKVSQTRGEKQGVLYDTEVSWGSKYITLLASGLYVSNDFEILNGYVPYNGIKQATFYMGSRPEWRSGILKGAGLDVYASRTDRLDGSHYENNIGMYGGLYFRSDYKVEMNFNKGRHEEYKDWVVLVHLTGNASNIHRRYGMNIYYGKRENNNYRFFSPYVNFDFTKRLSLEISSQFLWHKENRSQYILLFSYDITSERGLGMRIVYQNGKLNTFIAYRQTVRKGVDAYIILGDPNAEEMKRRVIAKIVLPI